MVLPTGKRNGSPDDQNRLWRLSAMGFTLTTEVVAGTLLGWLADWAFGFERTWIIVGAVAGVLVGMTGFIHSAMAENRRLEKERRDR
ncbi:MAG: AtpZ/AtpI family protein [Planctomycetes bacterium]|jgi:F0F1-type ATP synthase assembly protein I|nr:AtpZ/AtpI family protein [Planctomycetota bacterium]MCP4839009.1 AtpZ/AtpI family protein [Planctomycetota bacterium]